MTILKAGSAQDQFGTGGGGVTDHGALTGLTDDDHTQYILNTLLDANTVLAATVDNTPIALPVAASRFLGRKATGDLDDMTVAEAVALLATTMAADAALTAAFAPLGTTARLDFATNVIESPAWAANAMDNANEGKWVRILTPGTGDKVGFVVGTQSGNISVAAYSNTGSGKTAAPGTRLATSGAVSCPATGYQEVSLGASVTLAAGDWLFLSADNTTATFGTIGGADSDFHLGFAYRKTSSHPAPASNPASLVASTRRTPLLRLVP